MMSSTTDETEKKAFYELKKRMEGEMDSDLYEDDNVFYRFLKARDFKVNNAESMLREHLKWRKKYDVKNISRFQPSEVLKKYSPANYLGHTKEGHVIRYMPSGNIDCQGVVASCKLEECMKYHIKFHEEDLKNLKNHSKKIGKLVDKIVYIHDMKGLTFARSTDRKVMSQCLEYFKIYLNNYPETLKYIITINAPIFFGFFYSVMKTITPDQVLKKIKVYTDDSYKKDLLEIIDAEVLPAFLGGKRTDPDGNPLCKTFINHAGELIPETYYIKNKPSFDSLPDVQKETVPRAKVHEMRLEVKKPNSYLEWEFQLKSNDIKFGIVYEAVNGEKVEVYPLQRITRDEFPETGTCECENIGTYIIVFDNSYSILKSKEVFYKINIMSP